MATVGLVLVCGCGPAVMAPTPTVSVTPIGPVTVTVGLYSGRPDPEWTLTPSEVAALDRALAALPESQGTQEVGGLGYHGFTIARPGSTSIAYRGVIAPAGSGERRVRADPARSIERLLLEAARSHLTAQEYTVVQDALAAP